MAGTIVWFRSDLRLGDNPALSWAVARGEPVIPVYLGAEHEEAPWAFGGASKWWLHHSLQALQRDLHSVGSSLTIRTASNSVTALIDLIGETGATAVVWNRRYEPNIIKRDSEIKSEIVSRGVLVESFNGSLLCEPWKGVKADGSPYQVFTPYWKNQLAKGFGSTPLARPSSIPTPPNWPRSEPLSSLSLLPSLDWANGFTEWQPGEDGATKRLNALIGGIVSKYASGRDLPAISGTSKLSPHLHFGEISPNLILHTIRSNFPGQLPHDVEVYVKELVWREFANHLLFHFPSTPDNPLNPRFKEFPWVKNDIHLRAWQTGQTGYPIVDAGMRELWSTGWMHNRVRMIVASFLVKHLRIDWRAGAAWFWDTLLDADLASNTMGWQWSAGCGADAAPYFRIFNPIIQGEKFDSSGDYVKRWCPELRNLGAKFLHSPWEASEDELRKADVKLGETYPLPIVDHAHARTQALAAYQAIRG